VRQTAAFKIQVFRNWDATSKKASKEIFVTNAPVPQSKYAPGPISGYKLTASNKVVQEATAHTHKFTQQSTIPGTSSVDGSKAGVHIYFPPSIPQNPALASATSAVNILGDSSAVDLGGQLPSY
jgi:hypothetical protein